MMTRQAICCSYSKLSFLSYQNRFSLQLVRLSEIQEGEKWLLYIMNHTYPCQKFQSNCGGPGLKFLPTTSKAYQMSVFPRFQSCVYHIQTQLLILFQMDVALMDFVIFISNNLGCLVIDVSNSSNVLHFKVSKLLMKLEPQGSILLVT